MTFIDNLAYLLFSISFGGFLLAYTAISMYLVYRHKRSPSAYTDNMRGVSAPMLVIGVYLVAMGLIGQATWPLPGSYNILFFDPVVSFGIVILSFALAMRFGVKLEYAGFLGLMIGLMTLAYGAQGYSIGLTEEPLALLGLYAFYGLAGVFSYPAALIFDRLPGLKKGHWRGWDATLALFLLFLIIASIISTYIGYSALGGHLLTTP